MIILDIETQDIIPADRRLDALRISIAGVLQQEEMRFFSEEQIMDLFLLLDETDLIVGHNLLHFDYKILQRYAQFDVCARYREKTFDIFSILLQKTDRPIGLNDLAIRNLGVGKSGEGVDAPRLFQEGMIEELKEYLAQDLRITAGVFKHIQEHSKLKYGHIVYKEIIEREVDIKPPTPKPPSFSA
jgi:hypothetical protein